MKSLYRLVLSTVLFLVSPLSSAENYDSSEWSIYATDQSSQSSAIKSATKDGFQIMFSPTHALGHWFRVSATTIANSPDFEITLHQISNAKALNDQHFPTICEIIDGRKICNTSVWLSPKAALLQVTFSWPKDTSTTPTNIKYELAKTSVLKSVNEERYNNLIKKLKETYYLSNEVDWDKVHSAGADMLNAPPGIDPVPRAIWEVINTLPGNDETTIHSILPTKPQDLSESRIYPTCIQIDDSTWRLDLPGTFSKVGNRWFGVNAKEYVYRAHECLSQSQTARWIINLTEQKAGNAMIAIEALAPVLAKGTLWRGKDNEGKITSVEYNGSAITYGTAEYIRFNKVFPPFKGRLDFIIDKDCGVKICADIVLGLEGQGRLLGQPSATPALSNWTIDLNDQFDLQYTTRWIVDAQGKVYSKISPDGLLDEKGIERVLTGELR